MIGMMREKFGPVVVGVIIGLIAFVFIFWGIFSPDPSYTGATAGSVNGEIISLQDFNRELNRRMEFFKNMGGSTLSEEQLKAFRIRDTVFQELVTRKLLIQETARNGMIPSNEAVRHSIQKIDAFLQDGKFDKDRYDQVLQANQYSSSSFEKMVRDDIAAQNWNQYLSSLVRVSEEEIKREYSISQDRRTIRYVVVTADQARKEIAVTDTDIDAFLKDESKLNLAKSRYEAGKETKYKDKTFETVGHEIAREILASEKTDEVKKAMDMIADKAASILTASTSSDGVVTTALKKYSLQVKTSPALTRRSGGLPGLGDAKEILADAFADNSSIDPTLGGKAKRFSATGWAAAVVVSKKETPDLSRLDTKEMNKIRMQVVMRRGREIQMALMKQLQEEAKIKKNPAILDEES